MAQNESPDSVAIPLNLKIGIEVAGPAIYLTDKNNLSIEGYLSVDINERRSVYFSGGYSDFKYAQYNYSYLSKGFYAKAGVDFNLLNPLISTGKYWAGIGIHYGLSSFISETPYIKYENYWGTISSSIPRNTNWSHFIEASPGFRAEIFRNFSIGWSICLRKMIYTGAEKDLKPIYIPGYGSANKSFSTGISYYLMWNIPYKKIRVTIKRKPPPETGEQEEPGVSETGVNAPLRNR